MNALRIISLSRPVHWAAAAMQRPFRRGIAIMLVLFCIAAASIMAAAYVASRENAPQLTTNVVSGSTARMAATAGLGMARAIFECEDADFRSTMINGVLIENTPVGNGTVTVIVTALDGSPVTRDTQYFDIKATGSCEGMQQVAEAQARVAPDLAAPSPTFADFALFGIDQVEVDNCTLTRWALSPDAKWGAPIWVGTNSIVSGRIALRGAATVLDTIAQVDSDGGAAVFSDASTPANDVRLRSLAGNLSLPVLLPPTPNTSACSMSPTPDVSISSGTILSNDSWTLNSVRIANTGKVRVNSSSLVTRHVTGNVTIADGGQLLVETDHDFIIDGDLTIRNGASIQVSPGVRFRLWVGGNLTVDAAALGVSWTRAATVTDPNRALDTYKNPDECLVYQWPTSGLVNWVFDHQSAIVARAYGPNAATRIDHSTCYMGSLLAQAVRLLGASALHYDPSLDNRGGYTNTNGPLYNDDGSLNTELIATVTDISDASLASLAALLNVGSPSPLPLPGDPSPRNRVVEWTLLRTGIEPVKDQPADTTQDADSGVLPAG